MKLIDRLIPAEALRWGRLTADRADDLIARMGDCTRRLIEQTADANRMLEDDDHE